MAQHRFQRAVVSTPNANTSTSSCRHKFLFLLYGFLALDGLMLLCWPYFDAEIVGNSSAGGDQRLHLLHHHPIQLLSARDNQINDQLIMKVQNVDATKNSVEQNETIADAEDGKERVLNILRNAGVPEDVLAAQAPHLPTWRQIVDLYGSHPVILGLSSACAKFREMVPAESRILGAAGMFSTGTNLVTHLLKQNCVIPERVERYGWNATKEQLGMRWQVPWGKHTPQHFRLKHAAVHAVDIQKEHVLPVITVRNPWRWMQSMCRNPYTARWSHAHHKCPNLRTDHEWNEVTVKYGAATDSYTSLQHLWNDWYNDYLQASIIPDLRNHNEKDDLAVVDESHYPWVMVRIEDLVFHTVETITKVCECAGGTIRSDRPFKYIQNSAKADSPGHDTRTGLAEAWIKYSRPLEPAAGFTSDDYEAALEAVDQNLMDLLHYNHPPPPLNTNK